MIYLDHNATTPVHPEVRRVLVQYLDEAWANPSSGYSPARDSRAVLDAARIAVAGLLGAAPEEIVLTSGGTESVNTAIASAVRLQPGKPLTLISSVEHSACEHAAIDAVGESNVLRLQVDPDGRYNLDQLAYILATHAPQIAIASLMWANNETGVLPGIEAAAELITGAGVLLHTDAVQAAGKVPVDLCSLPADYLSISGHKIFAPKGVGALVVRTGAPFHPLLHGGGQEAGRRSGTEPVALAAALGAACQLVAGKLTTGALDALRQRRDHFERRLLALPGAHRNGHPEHRTPNTCNLRFEDVSASLALVLLDECGICCSSGSACKARSGQASHVLQAMGRTEQEARSSFRFSLSVDTTETELDQAVDHITETVARVRAATTAEA